MNPNFAEAFHQCCSEARNYIGCLIAQTTPAYIAAHTASEAAYTRLQAALGGQSDLPIEFDDAKNAESAIGEEALYQQGFRDCIYLLRWIGLLT